MTNFTENQQLFSIFVETLEPPNIAKSLSSYISYILQRVHNGGVPPSSMDPTVIHGFVAKFGSQKGSVGIHSGKLT